VNIAAAMAVVYESWMTEGVIRPWRQSAGWHNHRQQNDVTTFKQYLLPHTM